MKSGIELIAEERATHPSRGWTPEHDDEHTQGELSLAGSVYASVASCQVDGTRLNQINESALLAWPFGRSWCKPSAGPIDNLVRAGALIAAEIDRLKRLNERINQADN